MPKQNAVDSLFEAVKQLPPDELAEFIAMFAEWHESTGHDHAPDQLLIQRTRQSLSAVEKRRLRNLTGKSERQQLTDPELTEYRQLAERAERVNANRVLALAELAQRRGQPIQQVMRDIGWAEPAHGC